FGGVPGPPSSGAGELISCGLWYLTHSWTSTRLELLLNQVCSMLGPWAPVLLHPGISSFPDESSKPSSDVSFLHPHIENLEKRAPYSPNWPYLCSSPSS